MNGFQLFSWPTLHIRLSSGLVALLCAVVGCPLALFLLGDWVVHGTRLQAAAALVAAVLLPVVSFVLAVFDCCRTRPGKGGLSLLLSIFSLVLDALWAVVFHDVYLTRL